MNPCFNLWDAPWIRVRTEDCSIHEVSLLDALLHARGYSSLAGESPAQDAAILRLLIAIVHTVFYRMDENGNSAVLKDEDDALDRWAAIWDKKNFPEIPLRLYREQWLSRFDLLDEEHPFYQVPEAKKGTPHTAAKLNGTILQSENKLRIFSSRTEEYSKSLSYSEAARWLIYLQGFDDASIKPKTVKTSLKTTYPKKGWLGNLGLLYAVGETLFETIWLNNVLLKDGSKLYAEPRPSWELPSANAGEYTQISVPDNLAGLFTIQSRRILLKRKENQITEYAEFCGDLLDPQDAFAEPMTVWRPVVNKTIKIGYSPRPHAPSRQLWRDFSAIAVRTDENRLPGISYWLTELQDSSCLERDRLNRFAVVSVLYDNKGSSVENTVSDTISFHADLLTKAGHIWQRRIEDQVQLCDKLAEALGALAGELSIAAGRREIENRKTLPPQRMSVADIAKTQYYFRIDAAFRQWLLQPEAGQSGDEVERLCQSWRETARRIACNQGNELVESAGEAAFLGRWIETEDKKGKRTTHYSSAEAFNHFLVRINRICKNEKRGE